MLLHYVARMAKPRPGGLAVAVGALFMACQLLGGPSHVKDGALYKTGDAKYDAYFGEVHELQLKATKFNEDKRVARRPLIDALGVSIDASEAMLVEMAHDKVAAASSLGGTKLETKDGNPTIVTTSGSRGDGEVKTLLEAIETTAKNELARAKEIGGIPSRAESLAKSAHELEPSVDADFAKAGGQKPKEVKMELGVAVDVLQKIAEQARLEAKGAEYFVATLSRAMTTGSAAAPPPAEPTADAGAPKPPPPKPPPGGWRPPPPKPPATSAPPKPPPTSAPPPKPPPKADPGEVFNP